jgi:hypothetical protein
LNGPGRAEEANSTTSRAFTGFYGLRELHSLWVTGSALRVKGIQVAGTVSSFEFLLNES